MSKPMRKLSPTNRSAGKNSLGYEDDGLDAPGRPNSSASESSMAASRKKTSMPSDSIAPSQPAEDTLRVETQKAVDAAAIPVQTKSIGGRIFHAIWATKLTEDLKDSTAKAKTMLREVVIYALYLTVLAVITFGTTSSNMFRLTDTLSSYFLNSPLPDFSTNTFLTLGHGGDWMVYMGQTNQSFAGRGDNLDGPFLAGMYWEEYYNGDKVDNSSLGYISYENKLLGVPRLRQVRVRNDSCKVYPLFTKIIDTCYGEFSSSNEDKSPFGVGNGTAWTYSTPEATSTSSYGAEIGSYNGGGYYQDLARTKIESAAIIADLNTNRWIDRGTRVVFIDFTVYNANFNLFSVVRLITEFPTMGAAWSSYVIRTVKLLRYETAGDFIVMGFEYVFCAFVLYYIIEEIAEIRLLKLKYFKGFWNIMDIFSILLSLISIGFNIYRTIAVEIQLEELLLQPDKFPDFEHISYWQFQFNYVVAILVFVSWVKIFKYLSFNRTMNQMTKTLSRAKQDLGGFFVMFFIVFFAFAQLGYLLFGSQVQDYRSIAQCCLTLFRILLGDFDYHALSDAHRTLGPLFFLFYVLFVLFVLFNMFMAILNDSYSEVKSDLVNVKNDFEVFDFFKEQYSAMLQKLHLKRDKIVDIQDALRAADHNGDRTVTYAEWTKELLERGYSQDEISKAFQKYDIDQNGLLDAQEQDEMMADLEAQKNAVSEEMSKVEEKFNRPASARPKTAASVAQIDLTPQTSEPVKPRIISEVSYNEFNAVARRIDRLEHSIGSIVSKIDCVLVKLEVMETAKLRRREAMTTLLDSLTAGENFSEDERKRQMERLVKEELERFDSEVVATSRPGTASSRPGTAGPRPPTANKK